MSAAVLSFAHHGARPHRIADFPPAIAAAAIPADTLGIPRAEPVSIHQLTKVIHGPAAALVDKQFRMLVYLADRAERDGSGIFPDPQRLAAWAGCSEDYATRFAQALRRHGWLSTYADDSGFSRWRLKLPDGLLRECEKPVENLLKTDHRGDPRIGNSAPRIADRRAQDRDGEQPTLSFDSDLPSIESAPPSFLPSLIRPEQEKSELTRDAATPHSSQEEGSERARLEALEHVRMLKVNLDVVAPARERRQRP